MCRASRRNDVTLYPLSSELLQSVVDAFVPDIVRNARFSDVVSPTSADVELGEYVLKGWQVLFERDCSLRKFNKEQILLF